MEIKPLSWVVSLLGQNDINEEPAKLNRDVALRALCPINLFSKVVLS
jgi:hypothetical protein